MSEIKPLQFSISCCTVSNMVKLKQDATEKVIGFRADSHDLRTLADFKKLSGIRSDSEALRNALRLGLKWLRKHNGGV